MLSKHIDSQRPGAARDPVEHGLARLVARLGATDFVTAFAHQCLLLSRADQVTMFTLEGGRVHHVFAHRPGDDELAHAQSRLYLQSFANRDQILATRLRRGSANCVILLVRAEDIADEAYRSRLFVSAGLAGKIALLGPNIGGHCYLNFYYRSLNSSSYILGADNVERLGPLLLELLRKHEILSGGLRPLESISDRMVRRLRDRWPVLSRREAQVCAAILCGKSVEDISRELSVSHSTIRTFRRRAYGKLAIRRQSGLFAHCVGLSAFVTPKDDIAPLADVGTDQPS